MPDTKSGREFEEAVWLQIDHILQSNLLKLELTKHTYYRSERPKVRGAYVTDSVGNRVGYLCSGEQIYKFLDEWLEGEYKWHNNSKETSVNLNGVGAVISKEIQPDVVFFDFRKNTLYVVEIKFQDQAGSVDEKMQGVEFKKEQFQKILDAIALIKKSKWHLEFSWVLNGFFDDLRYSDLWTFLSKHKSAKSFDEIDPSFLGFDPASMDSLF